MNYKFFFIPAQFPEASEQALNEFLSSHSVLNVEKSFYAGDNQPGWSFCVGWVSAAAVAAKGPAAKTAQRDAVDYREILNEEDFTVYAGLRDLRKQISMETGDALYQIFSNKQLAAMVTQRVRSKQQLSEIAGVGSSRLERFAEPFLALLAQLQGDES